MSSEKSLTPQIRFKGFTEAWEQRKVFEIANRLDNLRVPVASNLRIPGNTPYYGANGIQDYVSGYTHDGEFVLVAEDGANDLKNYPVQYVSGKIWVNNHAHVLQGLERVIDNRFLSFSLVRCDIEVLLVGGGRSKLNANTLMNELTLSLPSLTEQRNIGELFLKLDGLITLHQRKLDALKKIKSALLEKMFPKDGSDIPEIRFAGFTEAWEQRKVADIASSTRGGGTPSTSNKAYWNGEIPWIQSSDLADGKLFGVKPRKHISMAGLSSSATQLVPKNSIAVVTRVGVGKLAFMPYSYTTSQDFLSLCRVQTEPYFTAYSLYQMLQSELQTVQGTSIKGMTKENLLSKSIFVPRNIDEQHQLGLFFSSLDNLITLHQRKLDALKKIKSALLEKMFV